MFSRTTTRRLATTGAGAAGLLLVALPAMAHPTFNPNQLTPGEFHNVDLVIPHGCTESGGVPADGETTSPTTQIAVQLRDEVVSFAANEVDGWTVTADADAVAWSDAGGSTSAPIVFPVGIQLRDGLPSGQEVLLSVLQTCEQGSVLWAAGEGEEGSPAAVLVVGETTGAVAHDDGGEDHGDMAMDDPATDDGMAMEGEDHEDGATSGDDAGHDDAMGDDGGDAAATDESHDTDVEEAAAESGDDGYNLLAAVMLVITAGGITGILKMN